MAHEDPTTRHLVERAKEGDPQATNALAAKTYAGLLGTARALLRGKFRRLRSHVETQDLVQSAYRDAIRALPGYEHAGGGSFRRWLAGILRNKFRSRFAFLRARRRDLAREVPLATPAPLAAAADSPSQRLMSAEERARLAAALDRLPERYRAVVIARFFEDLPWTEVGRRFGRSEEAAQMMCHRALRRLREIFEGPSRPA